eukprot:749914-Hanusia_phi.AAC.5
MFTTWTANISSSALWQFWFVSSEYLGCQMKQTWNDINPSLSANQSTRPRAAHDRWRARGVGM